MQQQSNRSPVPPAVRPLALLALGLLLGLGCAREAVPVTGTVTPEGGALVRVEQNGLNEVKLERERQTPPWESLALYNAGNAPIALRFWGGGRRSLLAAPRGSDRPEVLYSPFALLPEELLALSAPPKTTQVYGILSWLSPTRPEPLRGCFIRTKNAQFQPGGTIALTPGNDDAWVQIELSAPLNYNSVRVAWEADLPPAEPQLWITLDGDTWVRISRRPEQPRVDWLHPVDLTTRVAGNRRFWLRLGYEVPRHGTPEAGGGNPLETLLLRRVRVDREMQGAGQLKSWKKGRNTFDLWLQSKQNPALEIRLNAKK